MLTFSGRALVCALMLLAAACGRDANDKIEGGVGGPARNTQAEAAALFEGLCATRDFDAAECSCMRDRMLRQGTLALAFIGATYGGDLAAAAEAGAAMEEAERDTAIEAYFTAETTCIGRTTPDIAGGAPATLPAATLDEVRASCAPSMAQVCECRARTLQQALGDGAYDAAIAMNRGDPRALQSLAAGREAGWADKAADMYARTTAPCIVQAGGR